MGVWSQGYLIFVDRFTLSHCCASSLLFQEQAACCGSAVKRSIARFLNPSVVLGEGNSAQQRLTFCDAPLPLPFPLPVRVECAK